MHERKAPINKLPRSKAPKTQQVEGYKHQRKTSGLFMVLNECLFWHPQYVCKFRFLCKSFHPCKAHNCVLENKAIAYLTRFSLTLHSWETHLNMLTAYSDNIRTRVLASENLHADDNVYSYFG